MNKRMDGCTGLDAQMSPPLVYTHTRPAPRLLSSVAHRRAAASPGRAVPTPMRPESSRLHSTPTGEKSGAAAAAAAQKCRERLCLPFFFQPSLIPDSRQR